MSKTSQEPTKVARRNLPTPFPMMWGFWTATAIKAWAPGREWLWTVFFILWGLLLVSWIVDSFVRTHRDPFTGEDVT